ncbi:hypothetical protein MKW98_008403, partial [Papaver atlanticum]
MELLILSTLEWKMNPATPISLLDHIIRRFGLSNNQDWEFLQRYSKFFHYLPSVLVAAVMLNVIDEVETENPMEYQHQLMTALKLTKEDVNECYQFLMNFRKRELLDQGLFLPWWGVNVGKSLENLNNWQESLLQVPEDLDAYS